jgi:hypothetical protein
MEWRRGYCSEQSKARNAPDISAISVVIEVASLGRLLEEKHHDEHNEADQCRGNGNRC